MHICIGYKSKEDLLLVSLYELFRLFDLFISVEYDNYYQNIPMETSNNTST